MKELYTMLIKTDASANSNKFYEVKMDAAGNVTTRYGRVGQQGTTNQVGNGEHAFHAAVNKKKGSRGYREVSLAAPSDDRIQTGSQHAVKEVAKRDLIQGQAASPQLLALVDRLTQMNRHQIVEMTGGSITIQGNRMKTPLGYITMSSILAAQDLLEKLEKLVTRKKIGTAEYQQTLEQYLMQVPQKIPAQRGWDQTFFNGFTTFERQGQLLDQLEQSLVGLEDEIQRELAAKKGDLPQGRVFQYQVSELNDDRVFGEIERFYQQNVNSSHASSHLRLKRVFKLANPTGDQEYEKTAQKIGNAMRLWHGTRVGNVLSILRSGLIVPKPGGSYAITGRMFGDGLYFSDQSTKSLNYAYGYWDGGARDHNCFMFLCDVAMGKPYVPNGPGDGKRKGYDSCFAQGKKSGVHNNEMIVYDVKQAALRYLCEFDRR